MEQATFRQIHQIGTGDVHEQMAKNKVNNTDLFRNAESMAEGNAVVLDALRIKLSKVLSVPFEDLDPDKALYHDGVDFLLAVELRNWFAKEWNADVAVFDIVGAPTLTAVGLTVASKSAFKIKGN